MSNGQEFVIPDRVYCIGFSPYGELLATGGQDNAVRLWDVQKILNSGKADITNAAIALENHEKPVLGLIFNPAGTLLASVSDDIVRLWSIMD